MQTAQPLRGALLALIGLFLFACMDTTTKYLAARYDVPLIVACRYLGNLALMLALVGPSHGRTIARTQRTGLVIVRALSLAATSLLMGFALRYISVAEATAINFLAPLLVVVAAGPFLGERVGAVGWVATGMGFLGVLLIARPGGGIVLAGAALAFACVGLNVTYQLLSRVLARTETTIALLFYSALVGSVIFGLMAPWFLNGRVPSAVELALFLSLGFYGGLGHYLYTAAFRYAPASLLATINYAQLLWAGVLGWLVFGHLPDGVSLTGMAVICASGVMVALSTRRAPEKREV